MTDWTKMKAPAGRVAPYGGRNTVTGDTQTNGVYDV
jgi:hypothetical protein